MRQKTIKWTPEKEAKLKELWEAGKPTTQIACLMGLSKGSVIGKANRMNLEAHKRPVPKSDGRKETFTAKNITKRAKTKDPGVIVQDGANTTSFCKSGPKRMVDLNPHECRWSVSGKKGREYKFCAAPTERGKVYCEQHTVIAYKKARGHS